MGSKSSGDGKNINYWRDHFRTTNSDIFDIIEHAIIVAAKDCPNDFRVRRGRIVELLFSCSLAKCLDHDGNDHDGGCEFDDDDDDDDDDEGVDCGEGMMVVNGNGNGLNVCGSSLSYGDVEALTNEIEQEQEIIGEVYRIKEILLNYLDESDSVLFESLRRLQLMALTVDILKTTEIGKAVNGIRRHSSKQIRHLARSLIDGWKVIVDEWVKATQEIAEGGTPDSVNPSTIDEEEGLPSPPLDEGAFFATQTMELSQFFDGMDDDGNPRNCGEFNKNREVVRKPAVVKVEAPKQREPPPKHANSRSNDNNVQHMKKQETLTKPNRPSNMQSGPGRPLKIDGEMKVVKDPKVQQKLTKPVIQRRPVPQPEKLRSSNEDAVQEKLEATKRKLQERYQQAENAKRQRTIQVMEIHDLPKQGTVNKNTQGKFSNYNRHNGRK